MAWWFFLSTILEETGNNSHKKLFVLTFYGIAERVKLVCQNITLK